MISAVLIGIFVIGYLAIAMEQGIKVDKAAIALITGVLCWTVLVVNADEILSLLPATTAPGATGFFIDQLQHHLGEISEIIFFLLGAMTIVELIDAHDGFDLITRYISTSKRVSLLWIICLVAFFLSAALDNLTTTIVMISITRKLVSEQKDRWFFAGMIVIAANAGGAWSPIGDVTTTMLWIGGQITATGIMGAVFLESLVSMVVPLLLLSFTLKGSVNKPVSEATPNETALTTNFERTSVFVIGVSCLVGVPIFKTLTHLPPYMGVLLGLGILWTYTEFIHRKKNLEDKAPLSVVGVIRRIDTPSILFFLGILIAIAALQSAGQLTLLAGGLKDWLKDSEMIAIAIGALSAIVDNVPLVAASIGMYPIEDADATGWASAFIQDGEFWNLLAFTTGTGGSMLIIGSAAGVAAMGLEKITFGWYLKNISWLALLGFVSGCVVFLVK